MFYNIQNTFGVNILMYIFVLLFNEKENEMSEKLKAPKIVIAPDGCSNYLTPGKEYRAINVSEGCGEYFGYVFEIKLSDGLIVRTHERNTSHLNGGDWIVKERAQ